MKYNLSEITHLIRNRRSVVPETFTGRKVHREMVELVLTNATWAPSHGLTQPWRFVVFMDEGMEQVRKTLPELYRSETPPEKFKQAKYDKLASRLSHVNVVIALGVEYDRTGKIPDIEEVGAVACAVQNMYLTCTAYGLGGFWSSPSFVYSEAMNRLLGLENGKSLGLFYMGYVEGPWPTSHRRPLEYVCQWVDGKTAATE